MGIGSRTAVVAVLALSLLACARYAPRPLDPAAMRERLEGSALDDASVRTALAACGLAATAPPWRRAELTCLALQRNSALAAARAQVQAAAAEARSAAARRSPALSLGGERYLQAQAATPSWLWSVAFDLLLDGGTRRRLRLAAADEAVAAARNAYTDTAWGVRRDAQAGARALRRAQAQAALAARMAACADDWLAAVDARIAAGEADAGERLAPQAARQQATALDAQAGDRAARARADVARLLQLAPAALPATAWDADFDALPAPDADALARWRESALLHRADLARALLDYAARERELQQQVQAQYPQISLGPGYAYDHGLRRLDIHLGLGLPPLDRNAGAIAAAEARRSAAAAQVDAVQAAVLADIDAAQGAWTQALRSLAAAQAQREAAATQWRLAAVARRAGAGDRSGERAAQWAALQAELAARDAQDAALTAAAGLEDALRTPLDPAERALAAAAGDPP